MNRQIVAVLLVMSGLGCASSESVGGSPRHQTSLCGWNRYQIYLDSYFVAYEKVEVSVDGNEVFHGQIATNYECGGAGLITLDTPNNSIRLNAVVRSNNEIVAQIEEQRPLSSGSILIIRRAKNGLSITQKTGFSMRGNCSLNSD